MKKLLLTLTFFAAINSLTAQKYLTKTGHISFFSTTPMEDIEAHNYQATSVLNFEDGKIVFSILMKGFEFEKALMQEHFNEKYVESDEYPKATFKGQILNFEELDLSKDGKFEVIVKGNLTIHGETKPVEAKGVIEIKEGKVIATSEFVIAVSDFNINIPSVVKDKIAKEVTISVALDYSLYTK